MSENETLEHLGKIASRTFGKTGNSQSDWSVSQSTQDVRSMPEGVKCVRDEPDQIVMQVRVLNRTWWWLVPVIGLCVTTFIAPLVGGFIGSQTGSWQNVVENTTRGAVWATVISAILFLFVWSRQVFWLPVVVEKSKVRVGDKTYDRAFISGFRVGYSVETKSGALNSNWKDLIPGNFSGLRLAYGRWGEDMPYLINGYRAAMIVIYLNEMLEKLKDEEASKPTVQDGFRAQVF